MFHERGNAVGAELARRLGTAMKYGRIFAKILFGLFVLDIARNWIQWTSFPEVAMEFFQVSAEGVFGMNMLKTDMTAGVAVSGVFALLYFVRGKVWLAPAIVVVSVFLVTRLINMAMDGSTGMLWAGVGYELVFFATALFLQKTEPKETRSSQISIA